MTALTSEHVPASRRPLFDQLRHAGWAVGAVVGDYCVAWRGADEIVLHRDAAGQWRVVNSRSAGRAAA